MAPFLGAQRHGATESDGEQQKNLGDRQDYFARQSGWHDGDKRNDRCTGAKNEERKEGGEAGETGFCGTEKTSNSSGLLGNAGRTDRHPLRLCFR